MNRLSNLSSFGIRNGIYIFSSTIYVSWIGQIGTLISSLLLIAVIIISLNQVGNVDSLSTSLLSVNDPLFMSMEVFQPTMEVATIDTSAYLQVGEIWLFPLEI